MTSHLNASLSWHIQHHCSPDEGLVAIEGTKGVLRHQQVLYESPPTSGRPIIPPAYAADEAALLVVRCVRAVEAARRLEHATLIVRGPPDGGSAVVDVSTSS